MEKGSRAQKKKKKKDEGRGSEGSEQGGGPHSASSCGESEPKEGSPNQVDEGLPQEDDASDSQDQMSDLEDLPEYERELILAKRHEEHMIKEHRRILLKKLKPQSQVERTADQDDDANQVVQGGKAALVKGKKKVAPPQVDKADMLSRPTKEGVTAGKKQNKQSSKIGRGGTTASSAVERDLHSNDSHDEFRKGKDSSQSQMQEREATKRGENEPIDYQTGRLKSGPKGDGVKGRRLSKVGSETAESSPSEDSFRRKKSVKNKVKKKKTLHTQGGVSKKIDATTSDERNELYPNDRGEKREDWSKRKKVLRKGSHVHEGKEALRRRHSDYDDSGGSGGSVSSRDSHSSCDSRVSRPPRGERKTRETRTRSRSATKDHHQGKRLFEDSRDASDHHYHLGEGKGDPFAKETQTPERLIQIYKEEKKIKLDVYKYMTYEIITYFQLKKTFLLDMSEHVNFAYHIIGHLVKVNDVGLLVGLAGGEGTKNDPIGSDPVGGNPVGSNIVGSNPVGSNSMGSNPSELPPPNSQTNIFFITNVVKSESYFCIDRHTNVKFQVAHLESMLSPHFFPRLKSQMIKNKKLQINELTSQDSSSSPPLPHGGGGTFLCELNNISDQRFSVDEYNCIKLFAVDIQVLKKFHQFLREKIEDLKNFRYTERQIQDLVEMKKKQSFHEIFTNRKSLDAVPISRITVQREICSIQREIDTLNYAKRRTNPGDLQALSQLGHQIDALTRKKDILKGQLQRARTNLTRSKTAEAAPKEKPLRSYGSAPLLEQLPHKSLGVEERRGVSQLANYIHEEKKSFANFVTGKFADLPLDVHNKIVSHFLLGCLQRDQAYVDNPPADSSGEESGEDFHLFGVNIANRVTPFEELKRKSFN
ncbi:unnamed protein product [Plasmodium vivax]|uniref:(malaria parasite P. vivax) hypothetical protein n=1 Tax=Plasmodium vivax TaxID=5855 RepID=A0A8S4H807_PLAVI|nr:unnamed protein product [Plasmodium vivax]